MKDIICFDTEWRYNHHRKKDKFNLKCEYVLNTLKAFYGLDPIYEKFLNREDLKHYMAQFNGVQMKKNYQVIYISSHGDVNSISLEGETKKKLKSISLEELEDLCPHFFEGRIVHFSSCYTCYDIDAVKKFKRLTHAYRVSGYQTEVDAMDSVTLDMAYFNALQNYDINTLKKPTSRFQQHYASLIDYLQFVIV